MVVGGILAERRPEIPLQDLQILQHEEGRVGKIELDQLIPEVLLDHVGAGLGGLGRDEPVLARDLGEVAVALEVCDGRTGGGVKRQGGRRAVFRVGGGHGGCL